MKVVLGPQPSDFFPFGHDDGTVSFREDLEASKVVRVLWIEPVVERGGLEDFQDSP